MSKYKIFLLLSISFFFIDKSFAQNDSSYVRTENEGVKNQEQMPFKKNNEGDFKENVFLGFYPGFSWSNYAFSYELSPLIGLELLPKLSAGIGVVYKHTGGKDYTTSGMLYKYKVENIGGRFFAFYDVYQNFCAYVEYEGVSLNYSDQFNESFQKWQPAVKGGILYKSPIGARAAVNFLVLYNFLYKEGVTYAASPLDIRLGVVFFPFRSKGY